MKKILNTAKILSALAIFICASNAAEVANWNFDWKFFYGKNPNAYNRDFDDSSWRVLDLPHDYQIEQPWVVPSEEEIKKNGGDLKGRGFKPYGEGWYRKTFNASPEWKGKRVILDFEGVMSVSDVYINGEKVASNEYGYIGFEADISKYLDYDKPNVVAVYSRVMGASRWYTGGGIFRNVNIVVKNPVAVARHGVYITTPEISRDSASANVSVEVENTLAAPSQVSVKAKIFSPDGKEISEASKKIEVPANSSAKADLKFDIKNPSLWSPETPALYSAEVEVDSGNGAVDLQKETFGIRKIEFNPENGFVLNGKKVLLKGVNLHHDLGALGAAVYDSALERRIKFLKSMGVNNGSGSFWLSFIPAGSSNSKSFPVFEYSFQPLPARYPRTIASIGIGFNFFTIIERLISCGKSFKTSRTRSSWFSTKCVGIILAACSNHQRLIIVSSIPFPGTPFGIMTSNAERRSVATIRSSSPRSKFSRTLPLDTLLYGSPSTVMSGSFGRLKFMA